MANKEIVGWFTRGGKRVPIFKGEGSGKAKKVGSIKKTSDGKYEARSHVKTRSGKTKDPVLGTYDTKDRAKRRLKTERDMIREEEARKGINKTPKSFGNGPDGAEYARLASKKKAEKADKYEAYNKKVLEKHAKDIERHGSVSISFEDYSGSNKDFIKAAEKAGYHARYDRDDDAVVVSKSEKDDTLKNARYKRRNGNKIYY